MKYAIVLKPRHWRALFQFLDPQTKLIDLIKETPMTDRADFEFEQQINQQLAALAKQRPRPGVATVKFVDAAGHRRKWGTGCLIGTDTTETVTAHFMRRFPGATIMSVTFVEDRREETQ